MSEFCLFAFGSMTESGVHFKRIENFVIDSEPARAKGRMYRLEVGYPAFIEDAEAEHAHGQLLRLNADEKLLLLLDEFQGVNRFFPEKGLHYRKSINCELQSGQMVDGHVYYYNPKKLSKSAQFIADGSWQREHPLMTESFSDQQKQYIRKLGNTSGREIVPIKLPLYRELMGMELIVDKGRRVALSKLGREVFHYLD